MRLDTRALTISAVLTTAIAFTVCAVLAAVAPDSLSMFTAYTMHTETPAMMRTVSWGSYFVGLVCMSVAAGLLTALFATLYNGLVDRRVTRPAAAHPAPARG